MRTELSADELDEQSLRLGLDELGLAHRVLLAQNLQAYMALLVKWNKAYNLISVLSEQDMLYRHILDSAVVRSYLHGERVLDVGTGAGLPGLVLAMIEPQRQFFLLDANAKKIRFCRQVCTELGLGNVEVVHARVEEYQPANAFTSIVSRAFGRVGKLLELAGHLCAPTGRFLALKSANVTSEVDALGPTRENTQVVALRVPGLKAQRHLVIVDFAQAERSVCPK